MTMQPFHYVLFPHTTLMERDYRCLSVLLPHLFVMQVLRPPVVPPWASERFHPWPAVCDEEQIEQIKIFIKGFQEFAGVHGRNGMMASIRHESIAREEMESRFRIQDSLKAGPRDDAQSRRNLLVEAAVFLEMARDLDEHEADLEESFAEVEGLEDEFRKILGVGEEEDIDEALDAITPTLIADRSSLSFMLPKRIGCWLRLFANHASTAPPTSAPVLLALNRDAMEEILDPVIAERSRKGHPLEFVQTSLGVLPSFDPMAPDAFQAMIEHQTVSEAISSHHRRLEDFLRTPKDASTLEALTTAVTALRKAVTDFSRSEGLSPGYGENELIVTLFEDYGIGDLGACLDKEGRPVWSTISLPRPPCRFLHLSALG